MAVKPHQAFFLAARTDHAAGLAPILRSLPCSLPEPSFAAAALPSPAVAAKEGSSTSPHAPRRSVRWWRKRLESAGARLGPGARPEHTLPLFRARWFPEPNRLSYHGLKILLGC